MRLVLLVVVFLGTLSPLAAQDLTVDVSVGVLPKGTWTLPLLPR